MQTLPVGLAAGVVGRDHVFSADAERLLLFSLLLFGAAAAGGLLPLFQKSNRRFEAFTLSFGAGIMIGTGFLHLIPEAVGQVGVRAGLAILVGYLALLVFEKFVMIHPCEEMDCHFHHLGLSAYLGISLHSLVDGLAVGASLGSLALSSVVFLSILVHKVPYSYSLGSLLRLGNRSQRRLVMMIALFALMTPLGAFLTHVLIRELPESMLGYALGFSAGNFLFVATSDLLPQLKLHDRRERRQLLYLLAGAGLAGLGRLLEH